MHFKMRYKIIKEQIAAWAAADPRLRAWLPQYDSLAGTAAAATYKPPQTNGYGGAAAAYLQNMPFGAVGMGAAMPWAGHLGGAAGYGGGPMQAFNSAGQPLNPASAPPASQQPRDLVAEFEARYQEVNKWRSDEWVNQLLQ